MTKVETIIIPSYQLLCAGDALGAELPIELANEVKGILALPVKSNEPLNEKGGGTLAQHPDGRLSLDSPYRRKGATWGSFYESPNGSYTHVTAFTIWFDANAEDAQAVGNAVWVDFESWYRRFAEFIEVISEKVQEIIPGIGPPVEKYYLWRTSPEGPAEMLAAPPQRFNFRVAGADDYIQLPVLQQAAELASTQQILRTEHRLLMQANRSLQARNLRVAILDAVTAVEFVLTGAVEEKLLPLNLSQSEREKLNTKLADGLMKKLDILKIFGISVPGAAHQQTLANPRNKAIHRGVEPTFTEAQDAVILALEIVQHFSPDYI